MQQLQSETAANPKVSEVRGLGLMQGIALHEDADPYLERLHREYRVACIGAGPKVLRLLPPLSISWEELELGKNAIVAVLS